MSEANVSGEFASVLRSGRDNFNARFAEARHRFGELDAGAFLDFLRYRVDPLVSAAARLDPGHAVPLVEAAYDVGLSLVGQGLAGPRARMPFVDDCFAHAMPALLPLIVQSPSEVLAALANATHHVSVAGGRPREFVESLVQLGPRLGSVEELLEVGTVLAWRCGLAHFRQGALAALGRLQEPLQRVLLGLGAAAELDGVSRALSRDPWFVPATQSRRAESWVGAFRGFGGLFTVPPRVTKTGDTLLVESAGSFWLLTADAFGATFHRATPEEVERAAPVRATARDTKALAREARGELTSHCELGPTVACTYSRSHSLLLLPTGA